MKNNQAKHTNSSATANNATDDVKPKAEKRSFPIVALGASAGGLRPLQNLLEAIPADAELCWIVIQHLDPDHNSMLVDILSKSTDLPVVQAEDEAEIHCDHIYVIPPNCYMELNGAKLRLLAPHQPRGLRLPIDHFFRSQAKQLGENAVSVVLSGTGSDGSLGIREVKDAGGLAIIQALNSCEYEGMPGSAQATGIVDLELQPAEIPTAIVDYFYKINNNSAERRLLEAGQQLSEILAILRTRCHYDFRGYRKSTLSRRVERRMTLANLDDLDDYTALLREDNGEAWKLCKDFLIGVTQFFRDPPAFALLEEKIIPAILADKGPGDPVRVWVAGCSSGEEAYSLAMLFSERIEKEGNSNPLMVFASDVDADALQRARAGFYPDGIASDITAPRMERFFKREADGYRIEASLRDRVVFAEHNAAVDAPFSRLDMVSCRNMLIYLERPLQELLLSRFHFALNNEGYLLLGSSESLGNKQPLYATVEKKWRIYQGIEHLSSRPGHRGIHQEIASPSGALKGDSGKQLQHSSRRVNKGEMCRSALLNQYAPASVLVNSDGDIQFFYGDTQAVLRRPEGEPTNDLLMMVESNVRARLRAALRRVAREGEVTSLDSLRSDSNSPSIRYVIRPLSGANSTAATMMVSFEPLPKPEISTWPDSSSAHSEQKSELAHLELELKTTREELQTTIEELESSNEELRSSNEEVTSVNEEFQSTNEELETSKEELQSLNEELTTVNQQLEEKINELERVNADLNNLIRSADIATIFLDHSLHIKRFTPASANLFKVIDTDIGRPVSDISHCFSNHSFTEQAAQVRENLVPALTELQADDDTWYICRTAPYRTSDNHIDGVLLTFTDITKVREAETELQRLNETLESRVEDRTAYLRLLSDIALIVNSAETLETALKEVMTRVCSEFDWPLAHAFLPQQVGDKKLADSEIWTYSQNKEESFRGFIEATQGITVSVGEGLLGAAMRSQAPTWTEDFNPDDPHNAQRGRPNNNHQGQVVLPLMVENDCCGLLEFFTDDQGALQQLDAASLEAMTQIGVTLGRQIERHRASTAQRQHDIEIAQYDRIATVGELGSSLAHEINQPLAAILNYVGAAKAAQKGADEKKVQYLLNEIDTETDRIAKIVQGLRSLVGNQVDERDDHDVRDLVDTVLRLISPRLNRSSVRIRSSLNDDLKTINGNRVQLQQVLLNLLFNAIEAHEDSNAGKPGEIRLSGARGKSGEFIIDIQDNGPGISDDLKARVFDPLVSNKDNGMGMGLAVSRSIAEAHGGSLKLIDSEGAGSCFQLTLPEQ